MPPASTRTESRIQAHTILTARLRARKPEIEQAAIARLFAISKPSDVPDPEYMEGLRSAIYAGLEYLLSAVELGEERSPQPPPAVLIQARLAVRCGVSLDTALRRCFVGYTLFGDFLLQEAEQGDLLTGAAMKQILRTQATLFDRLVAAVTEEYAREERGRRDTSRERRAKRVERLLTGEPLDTAEFSYDFKAHHLGVIACGLDAAAMLHELAADLDRRLLAVRREDGVLWAWLGGRRPLDSGEVQRRARSTIAPGAALAIGESGRGFAGWRLTHRQARAGLPIAQRGPESVIRYVDVALFSAVLQNDLLATSLRELYLTPLRAERGGGEVLRETMRAYFAAEGNVSSAASALGVKRETVRNRLRTIERRLGRDLNTCAADLEAALRLEELADGQIDPSHQTEAGRLPERAEPLLSDSMDEE